MTAPSTAYNSPRIAIQRGVTLAAMVCVAGCMALAYSDSWPQMRMLQLARALGWAATGGLLATLSSSPIARTATMLGVQFPAGIAHLRRALGIATALLALLHGVVAYVVAVHPQPLLLWSWPHLHFGVLALAVLLLLLATSFPRVVKVTHLHAWKELHRLAYVAAVFSLLHAALSPWASRMVLLWAYGLWAALKFTTWAIWRARA